MKKKKKIKRKIEDVRISNEIVQWDYFILKPCFFGKKKHDRIARDNQKYSEGWIDALNWVLNED